MTIEGKVRNGKIEIDSGLNLPDGTVVRVEVPDETPSRDPAYTIAELAVDTGISDLSKNLDHYLYGHPKRGGGG